MPKDALERHPQYRKQSNRLVNIAEIKGQRAVA